MGKAEYPAMEEGAGIEAEYPAMGGGAGMYEAESSAIEKDSDINGGAP